MENSVVLLSAGLDSTYNLWRAKSESQLLLALTFDYGQRASAREVALARQQCKVLGVPHRVVSLPWFADFNTSALIDRQRDVPQGSEVSIDDLKQSQKTAQAVWVPNRNGIFLNIAAGFAEGLGAQWVIPGFNVEEAATFPDNSEDFMEALSVSFSFSTANRVKVKSFTSSLNKTQIISKALQMGVALDLVWSCYFGEPEPCGGCESCLRFIRAAKSAQVPADRLSTGYGKFL